MKPPTRLSPRTKQTFNTSWENEREKVERHPLTAALSYATALTSLAHPTVRFSPVSPVTAGRRCHMSVDQSPGVRGHLGTITLPAEACRFGLFVFVCIAVATEQQVTEACVTHSRKPKPASAHDALYHVKPHRGCNNTWLWRQLRVVWIISVESTLLEYKLFTTASFPSLLRNSGHVWQGVCASRE